MYFVWYCYVQIRAIKKHPIITNVCLLFILFGDPFAFTCFRRMTPLDGDTVVRLLHKGNSARWQHH